MLEQKSNEQLKAPIQEKPKTNVLMQINQEMLGQEVSHVVTTTADKIEEE